MRIGEWMTPAPVTVAPSTPVPRAHDLMRHRRIRHLPVLDGGRLVGIVTDRDLRTVQPSPATGLERREMQYILDRLTVGQVMSRGVITVGAHEPLAEAIRLMLENRIGGLPVIEHERLVGILTAVDLLRAFSSTLGVPTGRPPRPPEAPIPDVTGRRLILVALDGSPGSETVLETIGELARNEGAVVRLLHVARPVGEVRAEDRVVVYADQETRRVEGETTEYFRRVAGALGDVPVEFSVRFGDPEREIVSEAEEVHANLIAMASHRRTGIARFVRGSVAERVERATTIPVMLVQHG